MGWFEPKRFWVLRVKGAERSFEISLPPGIPRSAVEQPPSMSFFLHLPQPDYTNTITEKGSIRAMPMVWGQVEPTGGAGTVEIPSPIPFWDMRAGINPHMVAMGLDIYPISACLETTRHSIVERISIPPIGCTIPTPRLPVSPSLHVERNEQKIVLCFCFFVLARHFLGEWKAVVDEPGFGCQSG